MSLQDAIKTKLFELGFCLVHFTQAPLASKTTEFFKDWLQKQYHGEMKYLENRCNERIDPKQLLASLKSVIMVAYPYDNGLENSSQKNQANISRYAWGADYHEVLREKLQDFQTWLSTQAKNSECYLSVDSSPVLEKSWAQKAGLGWMGKHTNMIHPKQGSYFFLGSVFTNLELKADKPIQDHCGSCQACIDVCPTQAIIAPYVLDARRCISYLTIELKGPIPLHFRPLIGNHVFGCDDCQEVCPWNRFSQKTHEQAFFPQAHIYSQPLSELIQIKKSEFKRLFSNSAILRAKWKGLMRNVLVAIGNTGDKNLLPLVEEKLACEEALVRGHAVWAYGQLLGKAAYSRLLSLKEQEDDSFVLEELNEFFEKIL